MFGWRARIGYLCPSVFEMIAYDFYRIVPPGRPDRGYLHDRRLAGRCL